MNSKPRALIAGQVVEEASRRVEGCHTDLEKLLSEAKRTYRDTLAELDSRPDTEGDDGAWLTARLAAVKQMESLRQSAGEFDAGIDRLSNALTYLSEARDVLEGKGVWLLSTRGSGGTSLEAVAIQAQEEERYRLAREIHDGPAQILANMALQMEYISRLAAVDAARVRDEIATLQKDLRVAVGEVRRFMYDLRPPALAQQGVGAAVESHCQRLADRFGLEIEVTWRSTASLPPPNDTAVFRVVQEALQNVVKHARATRVHVRCVERDALLEVSVTDNGRGFDRERLQQLDPSHFGLAGMRARAQQIGANLEVSSSPGAGTSVLLRVPLPGDEQGSSPGSQ